MPESSRFFKATCYNLGMKIFYSELGQSYKTYSFAYCPYAHYEPGDYLQDIYDAGFLPYSGTPELTNIFYMARSLRINLPDWELNSENRRIYRKFEGQLEQQTQTKHLIDITNETFLTFCEDYFSQRHGATIMPRERLKLVLETVTDIVTYKHNDKLVGYVFLVNDEDMSHYWYSFYDLDYANQSLGLWMMTDCAIQAKKQGKQHFYLGTAYSEKGIYKTNYDNLEYWNGQQWSQEINLLRDRCRSDHDRTLDLLDEWKQSNDHQLF